MKKAYAALAALILFALTAVPAGANVAEPPNLTVIVINAPADVSLELWWGDGRGDIFVRRYTVAWETRFRFNIGGGSAENLRLRVSGGGESFSVPIEGPLTWNHIFTLDFEGRELIYGAGLRRSVTLVSLRLGLTLLIEGLIFFMFGFRAKRSWLIFLCANLVTQGLLNIWLNSVALDGHIWIMHIFLLFIIEPLIFLAEAGAYYIFMREHDRRRRIICALAANFASFVLGGALITWLPV